MRFPCFYSTWCKNKFKNLFVLLKNNTLSRAELNYNKGKIKNIHYGDILIKFNNFVLSNANSIPYINDESIPNKYSELLLKNGDLIIADTAEDYSVGKATELIFNDKSLIISGLHTIPCRPVQNIFASKYLGYYINSPSYHNQLLPLIQGIKVSSISKSQIVNTYITYPDIKEQNKIAKFLTLIEQRIDTQSKIIEDLELFEKEINNTIINKLVEHKDLVKFSSLYNFAKEGGTPNTSHPEYYTKGSIPFVKIDDLTTKYLVSNQSFITKLGLENSSAWLIPANSILYSNGATIGAISINKYPVTTKQGILGIVPKSDYLSDYLYYFLRSNYFKKEICRITTQGTMKSAYIKDIDNILVPHVNKNQQNEILTLLSEITLKIEKEKDILELYRKQKAYLLKNMFI